MLCPRCKGANTSVLRKDGTRRRRECHDCAKKLGKLAARWSTDERPIDEVREARTLRRRLAAAERAEARLRSELAEIGKVVRRAAG